MNYKKLNKKVSLLMLLILIFTSFGPFVSSAMAYQVDPVSIDVSNNKVQKGEYFTTNVTLSLNVDEPNANDKWKELIIPLPSNYIYDESFGVSVQDGTGVIGNISKENNSLKVEILPYISGSTVALTFNGKFSDDAVNGDVIKLEPQLVSEQGVSFSVFKEIVLDDPTSWEINKVQTNPNGDASLDDVVTYTINIVANGSASINEAVSISDEVVDGQIVDAYGGNINSNTVTWNLTPEEIANRKATRQIDVLYSKDDFSVGDKYQNQANVLVDNKIVSTDKTEGTLLENFYIGSNKAPVKKASPNVNVGGSSVPLDGLITYEYLNLDLSGRGKLTDYEYKDNVSDGLNVKKIYFGEYDKNNLSQIEVKYKDGKAPIIITDFKDGFYTLDEEASKNILSITYNFSEINLPFVVSQNPKIEAIVDPSFTGDEIINESDISFGTSDGVCPPKYQIQQGADGSYCTYQMDSNLSVTQSKVYAKVEKTITDKQEEYFKDDVLEYNIKVTNSSESPASLYVDQITDILPTGLEVVEPGEFTLLNNRLVKEFSSPLEIKPSESKTFTYKVRVVSSDNIDLNNNVYLNTVDNQNLLPMSGGKIEFEKEDYNNNGQKDKVLYSSQKVNINAPKVTISKENNSRNRTYVPSRIKPGSDIVTYETSFENEKLNNFTASINNPSFIDTIPSQLDYVSNSLSISSGNLTIKSEELSNGQIKFNFDGELKPGEKIVFTYQMKVKDYATAGIIKNEIEYEKETNKVYNKDSVFKSIDQSSIIQEVAAQNIKKTSTDNVEKGGQINYDIVYQNDGTMPITNVVITDNFPYASDSNGSTISPVLLDKPIFYLNDKEISADFLIELQDGTKVYQIPDDRTQIKNFSADFKDLKMYPGDKITFSFKMVVPNDASAGIIFNSAEVNSNAIKNNGKEGKDLYNNSNSAPTNVSDSHAGFTIGDQVYLDQNRNGIFDSGEQTIDGVILELYSANGTLLGTTVSNNGGKYQFNVDKRGAYTIKVKSYDTNYKIENLDYKFPLNKSRDDIDIALIPAQIDVRVFNDLNQNGIKESNESLFSNDVDVFLYRNGSSTVYKSDVVTNGTYSFMSLPKGDYKVLLKAQDGYLYTIKDNFSFEGKDQFTNLTLDAGQQQGVDFGLIKSAIIKGVIWNDYNIDGIKEADEKMVRNIRVRIKDYTNNLTYTIKTDSNGYYEQEVYPSEFDVHLLKNSNMGYTKYGIDSSFKESNGKTDKFNLNSQEEKEVNGGIYYKSFISGKVFEDMDYSGSYNSGDKLVANKTVTLINANTKDVISTTTTDTSGNYSFNRIEPWIDYQVIFDKKVDENYLDLEKVTNDGKSYVYNIKPKEKIENVDAGYYIKSSIVGTIFEDENGDNKQQANENKLENFVIELYKDNQLIATKNSDSLGNYTFDNLVPANYEIRIQNKNNYYLTDANKVNDSIDSDFILKDGKITSGPISIKSSDAPHDYDAGFYQNTNLSGNIYIDRENNGLKDNQDYFKSNETLKLYRNGVYLAQTTTDSNGHYEFNDLKPGNYKVTIDTPLSTSTIINKLDLNGNHFKENKETDSLFLDKNSPNNTDFDGGLYEPVEISGHIFLDGNFNEIQDNNEINAVGLEVYLKDKDGNIVDKTNVDDSGNYKFLTTPSTYYVEAQTVNGGSMIDVVGGILSTNKSEQFTLYSSDKKTHVDGIIQVNSSTGDNINYLAGKVFLDENLNGKRDDGEILLPNIDIDLLDENNNVLLTTKTNSAGMYYFGVYPSKYKIRVKLPITPFRYVFTTKNVGLNDDIDSDVNEQGYTDDIIMRDKVLLNDAGVYQNSNISGYAFIDSDIDGKITNEQKLKDVTVGLYYQNNLIKEVKTDDNGYYKFEDIKPGNYELKFTAKSGSNYKYSLASNIDDQGIKVVSTKSGQEEYNQNAGFYLDGKISGKVFLDQNADGNNLNDNGLIKDVTLYYNNQEVAKTTSDVNGDYEFNDLKPGNYYVEFAQDTHTPSPKGVVSDVKSDYTTDSVNLLSGQENNTDFDGGFYNTSNISGSIFLDGNQNLKYDTNEIYAGGIKVYLKDEAGNIINTTTTDQNGFYKFTNIKPNKYYVEAEKWDSFSYKDKEDGIYSNNKSKVYEITSGSNILNVDGIIWLNKDVVDKYSKIMGNFLFLDANGDGIQNTNETGIDNVEVSLYNEDYDLINKTTTTNGFYYFAAYPGEYKLSFDIDGNTYFISPKEQGNDKELDSNLNTNNEIDTFVLKEDDLSLDAGVYLKSSISGYYLEDMKNDGKDTSDNFDENRLVSLYDKDNKLVKTTLTDDKGYYEFKNLDKGDYKVSFEKIDNVNIGKYSIADDKFEINLSLLPGTKQENQNLIYYNPISISGKLFEDYNGSLEYDNEDKSLKLKGVDLYKDGIKIDSTITNLSGKYNFDNLEPGNYMVKTDITNYKVLPQGLIGNPLNNDLDVNQETRLIELISSDNNNQDFDGGFYKDSTIKGNVFLDGNEDGIHEANEIYPEGLEVTLLNETGTVLKTTLIDEYGNYEFTNLMPGNYYLKLEEIPSTSVDPITDGFLSNFQTNIFNLKSGQTQNKDGILILKDNPTDDYLYIITGNVWHDENFNGIRENEISLENITLKLVNDQNKVLQTTKTDKNGNYYFKALPGDYKIKVEVPPIYNVTLQNVGSTEFDSDADENGVISNISLNENKPNLDIGLYRYAKVSGYYFEDVNNNGLNDDNKPLANKEVTLKANTEIKTTTDKDGYYSFENINPGKYTIEFTKENDQYYSDKVAIDDKGKIDIDLSSNEDLQNQNAAVYKLASLSGNIYEDVNGDKLDNDNKDLNNIKVALYDNNNNEVKTTKTDNDGNYSFTDIIPGAYEIKIENAMVSVIGGDSLLTKINTIENVSIKSAEVLKDLNAGYFNYGTLKVRVFLDSNKNNVYDNNEQLLSPLIAKLSYNDNLLSKQEINYTDYYTYSNLIPGKYDFETEKIQGLVQPNKHTQIINSNEEKQIDVPLIIDGDLYEDKIVLGNHIYEDLNANGNLDKSEHGIANKKVYLLDGNDKVIDTTTTDEHGFYYFFTLPGVHKIKVQKDKDEYISPKANYSKADEKGIIDLGNIKESSLNNNIGIYSLAKVSGYYFTDKDYDGKYKVENALENKNVNLLDKDQSIINNILTNKDGYYKFEGLIPSTYTIEFIKDKDSLFSTKTNIDDKGQIQLELLSGQNIENENGAQYKKAKITGNVFEDKENDKKNNNKDENLKNIKVYLYDQNNNQIEETKTDKDGNYEFIVDPGKYYTIDQETIDNPLVKDDNLKTIKTVLSNEEIKISHPIIYPATIKVNLVYPYNVEGKEITLYKDGKLFKKGYIHNSSYKFTNLLPGNYSIIVDGQEINDIKLYSKDNLEYTLTKELANNKDYNVEKRSTTPIEKMLNVTGKTFPIVMTLIITITLIIIATITYIAVRIIRQRKTL